MCLKRCGLSGTVCAVNQLPCRDCGALVTYLTANKPKRCAACREALRLKVARELKERYRNDPEWKAHVAALNRARYERKREQILAQVKEYADKNKDRRAKNMLRWQRANKARVAAANKAWKEANPDAVTAMAHNRSNRIKNAEGSWTAAEWRERLATYGGVCPCCGSSEDLTIDHIVPIAWGGNNLVTNLQPLCAASNYGKADRAIADYLPWNGEGPRLAFYEYLGPAPRARKQRISRAVP